MILLYTPIRYDKDIQITNKIVCDLQMNDCKDLKYCWDALNVGSIVDIKEKEENKTNDVSLISQDVHPNTVFH